MRVFCELYSGKVLNTPKAKNSFYVTSFFFFLPRILFFSFLLSKAVSLLSKEMDETPHFNTQAIQTSIK